MHLRNGLIALACVVAACSDSAPQNPMSQTGSVSIPSISAPFEAEVYLREFNEDCRKTPCWLPTQFEPKLVERESVSLEEKTVEEEGGPRAGWPMDGDKVMVRCITKGGQYLNTAGQLINDWYGIVVPMTKVEPTAKGDPRLVEVEQGYLGYVGISWLRGGEGKQLPACNQR